MLRRIRFMAIVGFVAGFLVLFLAGSGLGQDVQIPTLSIGIEGTDEPERLTLTLQILFFLTVLSLAPALLVMGTSFARIVVVLSFLRQAMGTQQLPPNQVIIGLSLFLTFFVMSPVWERVNTEALQPYIARQITQGEAIENAVVPLRHFMLSQTREKDIALFVGMSQDAKPGDVSQVPTRAIVPAFVISELKTAFQIGFMIYIPFLILDMVVASVLMSMGMLMLPPILISLPFKLLLFVLVDGWYLVVGSLMRSFV